MKSVDRGREISVLWVAIRKVIKTQAMFSLMADSSDSGGEVSGTVLIFQIRPGVLPLRWLFLLRARSMGLIQIVLKAFFTESQKGLGHFIFGLLLIFKGLLQSVFDGVPLPVTAIDRMIRQVDRVGQTGGLVTQTEPPMAKGLAARIVIQPPAPVALPVGQAEGFSLIQMGEDVGGGFLTVVFYPVRGVEKQG